MLWLTAKLVIRCFPEYERVSGMAKFQSVWLNVFLSILFLNNNQKWGINLSHRYYQVFTAVMVLQGSVPLFKGCHWWPCAHIWRMEGCIQESDKFFFSLPDFKPLKHCLNFIWIYNVQAFLTYREGKTEAKDEGGDWDIPFFFSIHAQLIQIIPVPLP